MSEVAKRRAELVKNLRARYGARLPPTDHSEATLTCGSCGLAVGVNLCCHSCNWRLCGCCKKQQTGGSLIPFCETCERQGVCSWCHGIHKGGPENCKQ